MGRNEDFRHVELTEYARSKRQARQDKTSLQVIITAIAVLAVGMFSLSVASGLEDARRIAAESSRY